MGLRDVLGSAGALAIILQASACDSEPAAERPPSPAQQAPAAAVAKASPLVDEATFRLALADAGADGLLLTLEARGGYHINQEFPFLASLSSDSAKLAKTQLGKDDARDFGELKASFPIAAELPPGEHEVVADVRFAVCTDDTCIPDKRTLTLKLSR